MGRRLRVLGLAELEIGDGFPAIATIAVNVQVLHEHLQARGMTDTAAYETVRRLVMDVQAARLEALRISHTPPNLRAKNRAFAVATKRLMELVRSAYSRSARGRPSEANPEMIRADWPSALADAALIRRLRDTHRSGAASWSALEREREDLAKALEAAHLRKTFFGTVRFAGGDANAAALILSRTHYTWITPDTLKRHAQSRLRNSKR